MTPEIKMHGGKRNRSGRKPKRYVRATIRLPSTVLRLIRSTARSEGLTLGESIARRYSDPHCQDDYC